MELHRPSYVFHCFRFSVVVVCLVVFFCVGWSQMCWWHNNIYYHFSRCFFFSVSSRFSICLMVILACEVEKSRTTCRKKCCFFSNKKKSFAKKKNKRTKTLKSTGCGLAVSKQTLIQKYSNCWAFPFWCYDLYSPSTLTVQMSTKFDALTRDIMGESVTYTNT